MVDKMIDEITRTGTSVETMRLRRQIRLSNQVGLFGAVATVPYQLFYLVYDIGYFLPIFVFNLLFIAVYLSGLLLNRSGRHGFARYLVLINACTQIFVVTYFIGAGAGVQLFYFAIGTILALIVRQDYSRSLAVFLGLVSVLYLFCHFRFAQGTTPIPSPWGQLAYGVSAVFAVMLAGGYSYLFRVAIDAAETRLVESNRALEKLSTTDALTGLANRRRLDQFLKAEWARTSRREHALSVLMCDVDAFKAFNDIYGHEAGDECLRRVGMLLDEVLQRPADFAARYGGEEFVVVLPQTGEEGARYMAERIRAAVEALAIPHPESGVASVVTLSMGVSTLTPEQGPLASRLLAQADTALYQAKAGGRNRVVFLAIDAPGNY